MDRAPFAGISTKLAANAAAMAKTTAVTLTVLFMAPLAIIQAALPVRESVRKPDERISMRARVSGAVALAVAGMLTVSCGGIIDPSQNTVETFTGTVGVQGSFGPIKFSASKTGEFIQLRHLEYPGAWRSDPVGQVLHRRVRHRQSLGRDDVHALGVAPVKEGFQVLSSKF